MTFDIWSVAKAVVPPGSLFTAAAFLWKWLKKRREDVVLDMLEHADGPLSVSRIHNDLLGKSLREIPLRHLLPTLKPGGDKFNEADQIPAKVPFPTRMKYWWRVKIKRELPTEKELTETMRDLKGRGYVEHVAGDAWRIARKG